MSKVLFLSPYDGMSHRFWRLGLLDYLRRAKPELQIHDVNLPARFFSWRQRGNSLTYANHDVLQQRFDLIIATSLTDLSALRGLNKFVGQTPALLYFHENQFAYPDNHPQGLIERQITSIYSALSADSIIFNSQFNRSTFLEGAGKLLKNMPDQVPKGLVSGLSDKSSVVPVALGQDALTAQGPAGGNKIVWNHRWEDDKGPMQLLEIVEVMLADNIDFQMSLLGQRFKQTPKPLLQVRKLLSDQGRLHFDGFIEDRSRYMEFLANQNIILSTAKQEFQGLAVQEAMQCGCKPVVPDALSYPEYVPAEYRYGSVPEAITIIASIIASRGESWRAPALSAYQWQEVGPLWCRKIAEYL